MTDAGNDASSDGGDGGPTCTPIPNLVAWWRGENNGLDESANYPAVWNTGEAYVAGKSGNAYSFTGASYLSVANNAALNFTGPFTISAWVQSSSFASSRFVDKITVGGSDGYLLDGLGGKLRVIGGAASAISTGNLATGAFVHVVGVYAGVGNTRVYINGVDAGSSITDAGAAVVANTLSLRFGADSTGGNKLTGIIDEVAIFGRALTATEVASVNSRGSQSLCDYTRYTVGGTVVGLGTGTVVLTNNGIDDLPVTTSPFTF